MNTVVRHRKWYNPMYPILRNNTVVQHVQIILIVKPNVMRIVTVRDTPMTEQELKYGESQIKGVTIRVLIAVLVAFIIMGMRARL